MAEWLRAVISFGSGVAGLSAPYPHPHSTHVCPFFSLTHSPWSVNTLTTFFGMMAPHAQELGGFGLRQTVPWFHELLSTHTLQIRVLSIVVHSHKEGLLPVFVFSTFLVGRSAQFVVSHFPTVVFSSSRREIGYVFPVHFAVGCKFFLTHRVFGLFSHVVRAVLTVMF